MTESKDDALRRIADRTVCPATPTCRVNFPGLPNEWCIHCLAQSGLEHLEGVRRRKFQLMAKNMAALALKEYPSLMDYNRVGGDCVCDKCGLEYFEHPKGSLEFLTLLCNGDQVKL